MAVQIQFRRGLSTEWSTWNGTLAQGEMGFETDTKYFKIGDGSTLYNALPYANMGPSGVVSSTASPTVTANPPLWLDTSATADTVAVNSTLPLTSGGYFRTPWVIASAQAATNGTLYFTPFYVPTQTTIVELGATVSALTTAGNCRMGIYTDLNGVPNALVVDSNTKAYASATAQLVTGLSTVLAQGWYWLAFVQQTGSATWIGVSSPQTSGQTSQRMSANNAISVYSNYTLTGVTTTLPSTAAGATAQIAAAPIAYVRTA